MDKAACRFTHKGHPVPIRGRERPGRIEMMPGSGGKPVEDIHLPDVAGYRLHGIVAVDLHTPLRVDTCHPIKIRIGDPHKYAMGIVRCGGEEGIILCHPQAPCIVAGIGKEFEFFLCGVKTVHPLAKLVILSEDASFESRIADHP